MDSVEQMVASLKAQVDAARDEFDLAVIFHAIWKPAAYDEDLHRRMGPSYASNAFNVVRIALYREMLLALMRLWDRQRGAVRLTSIRDILKDKRVVAALAQPIASRMTAELGTAADNTPWLQGQVEATIGARAAEAIALIDTYSSDSELRSALEKLKYLRDKVLAHRQVEHVEVPDKTATGEQVGRFMADMTKLIALLCGVAHANVYDPGDTAQVYDRYAELFWATAKGERTKGHPDFRQPAAPL